eukprot:864844-Lingulodinium_polyedra.AAC.1
MKRCAMMRGNRRSTAATAGEPHARPHHARTDFGHARACDLRAAASDETSIRPHDCATFANRYTRMRSSRCLTAATARKTKHARSHTPRAGQFLVRAWNARAR